MTSPVALTPLDDAGSDDDVETAQTAADDAAEATAPRPPRTGAYGHLRLAAVLAARTVVTVLVVMTVYSLLPTVFGWNPSVVISGSMTPSIEVGDVVLSRPVPTRVLRPGMVVLVTRHVSSTRFGTTETVLHRIRAIDPDTGLITLKGDANPTADPTPVRPQDVRGVAVLRIPWIGQPLVLWRQGELARLALLAIGLVLVLLLAMERLESDDAGAAVAPQSDQDGATDDDGPPAGQRAEQPWWWGP